MKKSDPNRVVDDLVEMPDEFYEHFSIVCDSKQTPIRIDKFLMDRVERVSRNKLQEAIRAGNILVDGKMVKANCKVKPGNNITLVLPTPPDDEYEVKPEYIPLDIVYEDEDVMVINKPVGLVVHPGVGNKSGTLVNGLTYYFQNKGLPLKEGNTPDRAGLVHRIDKDTSGLMLVAKNDYAMAHLSKQFFEHTIDRTYQAIVWGQPDPEAGTINNYIGRSLNDRLLVAVFPDGDHGKQAITHYKTVRGLYYVSLVECNLETGRTHQIRVHMKHIGHTLFNDYKYGGSHILKGTIYGQYRQFVEKCFALCPRQALHAKTIGFMHPTKNVRMQFDSALPDDMALCLEQWENYVTDRKSKLTAK